MVICPERGADVYDPADATAIHCLFSKIQTDFYLSGTGSPGYNNNNNDRLTAFDPGQPG